jgi:hypothetical protein
VNKKAILEDITTEYDQWHNIIEKMSPEDMIQPRACGKWSIKDVIAHIAWYEREMISLINLRQLIGSKLWDLSTDERNQIIFEQNNDRSLGDVIEESGKIHNDFIQALNTLSNEDLLEASHFKNMPGDWVPWKVIAGNSYEHYRQHIPDLMQRLSH